MAIIKKYHPYIKVIYTRTTDVFVPLEDRVDIANTNEADLFISIHCNSGGVHTAKHSRRARRRAYFSKYITSSTKTNGTETYRLDNDYVLEENNINTDKKYMIGSQANNSVLANNNYLAVGYNYEAEEPDPIDVFRSLTGLGRMYNPLAIELEYERLKKSYQVARPIEAEFASTWRKSRGVHQSHFLVLRETIRPAVLIETGFITNIQEEAYLHSDHGRNETASSIYKAISKYIEFVKSSI
ncbi:MAG: N-acetylmuramoyl-L-alanine amidase family protein [Solitalea-like symbiont of Acarus siro]